MPTTVGSVRSSNIGAAAASGEFLSLLGIRSPTLLDDAHRPFGGRLVWSRNDDRHYHGVDLVIGRDGFAVREIPVGHQAPLEIRRSLRGYVTTKQLGAALLSSPFVQLTVQKYLVETQSVVQLLAHHAECAPEDISYAGRKDEHADTTQLITMPQEAFLRFFRKHRQLRLPFRIGDPLGVERALKLSDLSGNHFRLVFTGDSRVIESEAHDAALARIAEGGFVNYFGPQRFGSPRYMTPVVGWHLNTGRVEEAVMALLASQGEPSRNDVSKKILGKNFKSLQRNLPEDVSSRDDHHLIEAIVKYPKRLWRTKIPASLWSTYNNAFESLLWNYVVSARIERYGMKGVAGDLWSDESGKVAIRSSTSSDVPDLITRVWLIAFCEPVY
ncbi:tRNA pseudouridine synthase D, putative [Perkinsus marinus ATCC 50983]|uniref:tRNA pseudouridine synthase D, putative n=1 Tax=Perkinsus marinus (strain ATCC 50983 / TXsc) TaxID=423536 RepID=C5K7A9_PERM5|nr:tRNA pseudouridine synthase D, putative [Perkinsus marinus ATCC 50983]EER19444.1 tRNA pseudouridine synthase D, putative [Perkinsus marinus ATCC 50983]|eukprot:XP_002787648.1 tRNA pseudouridine synthase D, putative [Perkinsus marinus ATCC 50983]